MKPAVSPSALRVQAALGDGHLVLNLIEACAPRRKRRRPRLTVEIGNDVLLRRGIQESDIGCTVAQIAKSIVFRAVNSGHPVLVIASGANRIDEDRVAELVGEPIARADANFVREATGFAIGGVPPVAHKNPPIVLIDDTLSALTEIWAAAGTPHAVVKLTFNDLVELTKGKVAAVARSAG